MQTRRTVVRPRDGLAHRVAVTGALACFVVTFYVAVVLGGGVVVGQTDSPSLLLSVVATAGVALLFAPVQSAFERIASRVGHPAAATPYDVLSRFSEAVTGGHRTAELPARMSRVLAEGTGAQWAQVWLHVSGRLTLAATWPTDACAEVRPPSLGAEDDVYSTGLGRHAVPVRHGGRSFGVLRLQERPGVPLTGVEQRLMAGLAAQAGLVLRLAALRAELEDRHAELVSRVGDLRASRDRLIAAHDAERRRLERDLHDGAQQHLVALTVNLRLAQTISRRSPERAAHLLAEQADAARAAIDTLTSLSRGIYPPLLAEQGLLAALRSAAATSSLQVTVDSTTTERPPAAVEAALYFCCTESVQNAAKHSGADSVSVRLADGAGRWRLSVADQGAGFDLQGTVASGTGVGLVNMRDRLDAVSGTLTVESGLGRGTTVTAEIPRIPDQDAAAMRKPSALPAA
jgi:signal transduction histidine kinase